MPLQPRPGPAAPDPRTDPVLRRLLRDAKAPADIHIDTVFIELTDMLVA